MNLRKPLLIAAALLAVATAAAQAPSPIPALPDTARVTQYSLNSSTCACSVGFALYGDGTDVDNWLSVRISASGIVSTVLSTDSVYGWTLTSNTGSIGSIARPITDGVITFKSAQTGTVTIEGAQRPRRLSQFAENRGVPARDLNQALTAAIAELREAWDRTNRTVRGQPGETFSSLPPPSQRVGSLLGFDPTTGLPMLYPPASGIAAIASGTITNGLLAPGSGGTFKCSGNGIAEADCTGLPINSAGTISGTSGGIPYFNSTTSLTSSGALASRGIVVGGGAGVAPSTSGCTIDTNNSFSCSSAASSLPQEQLLNTTSDTTSASLNFFKSRSGGNTNNGDSLGQITALGFANSGNQIAANITMAQAASSSGSNIPSLIRLNTSNASGQLNQTLIFDNNAHLGITASGTPSAVCPGSPSASGTDHVGSITTGATATTSCNLTFAAAFSASPICVVGAANAAGAAAAPYVNTISSAGVTFTYTSATSAKFNFICTGN